MRKTIYETNFDRLIKVFGRGLFEEPLLAMDGEGMTVVNDPYMKLSINYFGETDHWKHFYLAHTSVKNGDLMDDPGMEIRVSLELNFVEALSYTNHYMGISRRVYLDDGRYYPRLKKEQNSFLKTWLENLWHQGYAKVEEITSIREEAGNGWRGILRKELQSLDFSEDRATAYLEKLDDRSVVPAIYRMRKLKESSELEVACV